ncbi:biotin--[acetyl-CoA-carboxylase] ligase [Balneolaceae bacterium ANBcel3]|nr:biotin--[acetyl-CoA-carboxylase] ligase [Balneolaceae bacterium ANBcel3]
MDSTNRYLQSLPGNRLCHGLVCLADEQTHGKGQMGRDWLSDPGDNLTFSIVIKPGHTVQLQFLAMTTMLALQKTMIAATGGKPLLKWPNDVVCGEKKAAGILTESRYNGQKLDRLVFGIGVNINQVRFPKSIRDKAISLSEMCHGKELERELFLAMYLNRLELSLARAMDGEQELLLSVNKNLAGYGKWVSVVVNDQPMDTPVKILGVNEFGHLMVLTAEDDVRIFKKERIQIIADSAHMISS